MDDENILYMCRDHHRLQHAKGWSWLVEKYPALGLALDSKGWEIQNVMGIQKLVKK